MAGLLQNTVFGRQKIKVNTRIGGIAGTVNTAQLLATKLNISVDRIKLFNVTGVDLECAIIGGGYEIPTNCFLENTSISYYNDLDNLVTAINAGAFGFGSGPTSCPLVELSFKGLTSIKGEIDRYSNILNYDFPNCLTIANGAFGNTLSNKTKTIIIPKCTSLGTSLTDNTVFCKWWGNVKWLITIHSSMETINAGSPDGDLIGLNTGSIVTYV